MLAKVAALLTVALLIGGCSANDGRSQENGDGDRAGLRVGAATVAREALTEFAQRTDQAALLSTAPSDEIAAQIRSGAVLDVFISAGAGIVSDLKAAGLVTGDRELASNRIVIAVGADSEIESIKELAAGSFAFGVGSLGTPFGRYAEELLNRLPEAIRDALRANIRTLEPNLTGLIGKLRQGSIEAAMIYRSDVVASRGDLRALSMPPDVEPLEVAVVGALVVESDRDVAAKGYLADLEGDSGRSVLSEYGFGPPPERSP